MSVHTQLLIAYPERGLGLKLVGHHSQSSGSCSLSGSPSTHRHFSVTGKTESDHRQKADDDQQYRRSHGRDGPWGSRIWEGFLEEVKVSWTFKTHQIWGG